ncbi:MAG: spore coat protein [Clostridia bacterium]|nr:spore coat protein [Clostridia bacterium]
MEDRDLMEKELLIIKGVCDLYLHGTIESSSADVHEAFKCALNESLDIQNKIYNLMVEKGWYKTEFAEQQKIDQAKQKFTNQN